MPLPRDSFIPRQSVIPNSYPLDVCQKPCDEEQRTFRLGISRRPSAFVRILFAVGPVFGQRQPVAICGDEGVD
jgi:hypothetical protein